MVFLYKDGCSCMHGLLTIDEKAAAVFQDRVNNLSLTVKLCVWSMDDCNVLVQFELWIERKKER